MPFILLWDNFYIPSIPAHVLSQSQTEDPIDKVQIDMSETNTAIVSKNTQKATIINIK